MLFLFGIYKDIEKDELSLMIKELLQLKYLIEKQKETYIITEKGRKALAHFMRVSPFPNGLNGWLYTDLSILFWKRFTLYFQSLSEVLTENTNFVPIQQDIQTTTWVKRRFPKLFKERQDVAKQMYDECNHFLSSVSNLEANVFMMRLSGHHRVGYTVEQIATIMNMEKDHVFIIFQGTLHNLMHSLQENKETFPLLSQFIEGQIENNGLTESTARTYKLLSSGYSISDITNIRKLKRNTIEDHIVEITAHDPSFPIENYVPKKLQNKVIKAIDNSKSKRLKDIKQLLDQEVNYFMIRLILMRIGGKNGS